MSRSSRKTEGRFQADLKKDIESLLPGCIITKTDPTQIQGIPDYLILYGPRWALLENKKSATASHRPNQDYYVNLCNEMSFSRFVYPENKDQVLKELVDYMLN